jgi:D-alanyl-D-alanine carboxypeptidase
VQAVIVMDTKTGEVLYSSNPDVQTQPASMTKIMSFLIVFKALKQKKISVNDMIKVSRRAASQSPCRLGLEVGSSISVRDAILSMITQSANDVSVALAEYVAGSEEKFVAMMNQEAKRLNMNSTIFQNASGWKNAKQLTTVRDMAKLSCAIMLEYPKLYHLFSTKKFHYKGKCYANHNRLLGEKGGILVDGLKTGFVCASGFNIAVSAIKGSDRLVVVVVGGKSAQKRNKQVEWLLSCGFNKLSRKHCLSKKKDSRFLSLVEKSQSEKSSVEKPLKKQQDSVVGTAFSSRKEVIANATSGSDDSKSMNQQSRVDSGRAKTRADTICSGTSDDISKSEIPEKDAQSINSEKFESALKDIKIVKIKG